MESLHLDELKFSPGWNFIPGWNVFRLHEYFNPLWKQEYFNQGWNQKHHLQYVLGHDIWMKTIVKWNLWDSKNKEKEKHGKIVLTLSSALTTCLLLLQCYSILALKLMWIKSVLEVVSSRNNAIARLKGMKFSQAMTLLINITKLIPVLLFKKIKRLCKLIYAQSQQ